MNRNKDPWTLNNVHYFKGVGEKHFFQLQLQSSCKYFS